MVHRCEVCKLDLQDQYAYEGHILGKKHLKNAEQFQHVQSIIERSVFVNKIPKQLQRKALLNYFISYGEIAKYRFGPNHLMIEYTKKDPAKFLLSKPIYFDGWKLNILPRNIQDDKASFKKDNKELVTSAINDTQDLNYDNLKSIFTDDLTFDEQLSIFLKIVKISDAEIEQHYEPTCQQINAIFQNVMPKCELYRFGSTVSGLGFINCDLDIYMDVGCAVSPDGNDRLDPDAKSASAIFSEVKRILYRRSRIFSQVVPIPKAKTPIIKFKYVPSQILCDLSFKNSLAVHNSKLLKFYFSLNPCLRPAMMILKYWVSNYELRGGEKMTKYALALLFIFYLQQPTVKLVPPVVDLKRKCVPKVVEGWQVNFDETGFESYQKNSDLKSIPELLRGFCDFYANYDFKYKVICPIDGISYEKILFNEVEKLPESMDRYIDYLKTKKNPIAFSINKPMCMQDPNELNHNVTGNISSRYLEIFQKYCDAASKMCVEEVKNNYQQFLPKLFSLIVKTEVTNKSSDCFIFYANNYLTVGLPEDFESRTNIVDKQLFINENWFALVANLIKTYFKKVMKFQVQLVTVEREQKQQKIEAKSDVHSKDEDKIIMRCTGALCLWKNRKDEKNILDPSLSLLEKEIQLTENILKDLNLKILELKTDFECYILKKWEPNARIIVTLSNNVTNKNVFSDMSHFLKNRIPLVLNKTLVHMQQFKKKSIVADCNEN